MKTTFQIVSVLASVLPSTFGGKPLTGPIDLHRIDQELSGHNGYASARYPFGYVPSANAPRHMKFKRAAATAVGTESQNNYCSADLSEYTCTYDSDCSNYDSFHTGYNYYSARNPFSNFESNSRYLCLNNRCSPVKLGGEGDPCVSGLDIYAAQCEFPFKCSSNVCQRPLAAGCGPCSEDPTSCLPGTVCDSVTDTCSDSLQEGSQCVYQTQYVYETMEGTNDFTHNQTWGTLQLSCEWSQVDNSYDPTLTCDMVTQKCVRNRQIIRTGEPCDFTLANSGCDATSYCAYNYTIGISLCQEYSQLGQVCTQQIPCGPKLTCNVVDGVGKCVEPFSVKKGSKCGSLWGDTSAGGICSRGRCTSEGVCDDYVALGGICEQSSDCVSDYLCIDNRCAKPKTQVSGGDCIPWDVKISDGACQDGDSCINNTCTSVLGTSCNFYSDCGDGTVTGDIGCLCNASAQSPTCQKYPNQYSYADLFALMEASVEKLGISINDLGYAQYNNEGTYNEFLCNMLGGMTEDMYGDPWVTVGFLFKVFGSPSKILNCAGGSATMDARTNLRDFCSLGANYNLSAVKSLAGIPGAGDYVGVQTMARVFVSPPAFDPTTCGIANCSGNGICNNAGGCSCNAGFWGSACEADLAALASTREFIQDFYLSTSGGAWINDWNLSSPLNGTEYCSFSGITCDANMEIISIYLADNNLVGTIPESVGNLVFLQHFDVSGNFLYGAIPESFYNLKNLVTAVLADNAFEGPLSDRLYYLENLQRLDASKNHLSGALPWSLGYLANARVILLNKNNFTGTLPYSTVNMINVTNWDLTSNNFDKGTYLPSPLCPACDRTFTNCNLKSCDEGTCVEGDLLSCNSPTSYNETEIRPNLGYTIVNSNQAPEQCIYRFG